MQALHRDGLEGELSRARDELKGIYYKYTVLLLYYKYL
jgi:hypothetical protein